MCTLGASYDAFIESTMMRGEVLSKTFFTGNYFSFECAGRLSTGGHLFFAPLMFSHCHLSFSLLLWLKKSSNFWPRKLHLSPHSPSRSRSRRHSVEPRPPSRASKPETRVAHVFALRTSVDSSHTVNCPSSGRERNRLRRLVHFREVRQDTKAFGHTQHV